MLDLTNRTIDLNIVKQYNNNNNNDHYFIFNRDKIIQITDINIEEDSDKFEPIINKTNGNNKDVENKDGNDNHNNNLSDLYLQHFDNGIALYVLNFGSVVEINIFINGG